MINLKNALSSEKLQDRLVIEDEFDHFSLDTTEDTPNQDRVDKEDISENDHPKRVQKKKSQFHPSEQNRPHEVIKDEAI